jgi:hypothetical protein
MATVKYFFTLISALFINVSVVNLTLVNKGFFERYIYIYCLMNVLEEIKFHSLHHTL